MNDELANDRTYLAWLRTGIACVALGFVVAKAALIIRAGKPVSDKALYGVTGVLLVLAGAAMVITGYVQHRAVQRRLQPDPDQSVPRWPLVITVIATLVALLLAVLIAAST